MAAFEKDLFLAYATLSTRDVFFSRVARDASVSAEGRSHERVTKKTTKSGNHSWKVSGTHGG